MLKSFCSLLQFSAPRSSGNPLNQRGRETLPPVGVRTLWGWAGWMNVLHLEEGTQNGLCAIDLFYFFVRSDSKITSSRFWRDAMMPWWTPGRIMEILLLRNERFQLYSPKISDEFHATDSSRILTQRDGACTPAKDLGTCPQEAGGSPMAFCKLKTQKGCSGFSNSGGFPPNIPFFEFGECKEKYITHFCVRIYARLIFDVT